MLGQPRVHEIALHTFHYEQLDITDGYLESRVILPATVSPDVVKGFAIPKKDIRTIEGESLTSLFCDGDTGAPLLQAEKVVSVCEGWSLFSGSVADNPVRVLLNQSVLVMPCIDWIRRIVSDVVYDGNIGNAAEASASSAAASSASASD